MAEECTESSVATSSTTPNWWDNHPAAGSLSSWSNTNNSHWGHHPNPNSNSSCEEDVSISTSSFTNASNHSGLTVESSRRLFESAASSNELLGEHASDNQLWSQVLLNIGNGVELHNNDQDIGENFLEAISSKSISTTGIFEPAACSDYLKKMDSNGSNHNWETFPNFNGFDTQKHVNGLISCSDSNMVENERLLKLSDLVSTWSIALPSPEAQLRQLTNSSPVDDGHDHLCTSNRCGTFPSFGHDLKAEIAGGAAPQAGLEPCPGGGLFRRPFNGINGGSLNGYQNQIGVNGGKQYYGIQIDNGSSCTSTRNLADYISFSGRLAKPLININGSNNPCFKSMNLSADSKKQIHQNSSPTRISGRGGGVITSEGKKKRSEESSETSTKKPKQENSTASSTKMQQPKVKIGDRITALQQIVSPFGKTDTASVLTETIGYIKFLQEQVQLLSNPYMKTNSYKDPWQSLDRKDLKGDAKLDLRSRGLCLVPISCTPQVYRENTGSDYWTPYRGCFYR